MANFNTDYLELLRRQVDEEISFLLLHNHDADQILLSCPFCEEIQGGNYFCERLKDLRRCLANIMIQNKFSKTSVDSI